MARPPKDHPHPKDHPKNNPHPFAAFFAERGITQTKLAKVLGCQQPHLSDWFSGRVPMPLKWEIHIGGLILKIQEWEARTGKKFNNSYLKGETEADHEQMG
jgi:transcriptional regulator with XRE-family HTH domain